MKRFTMKFQHNNIMVNMCKREKFRLWHANSQLWYPNCLDCPYVEEELPTALCGNNRVSRNSYIIETEGI